MCAKPYLPPTKQDQDREDRAQARRISFGVRNFLKTQLHVLTFTIIHAIFSIYIHTRKAYHAVRDRTYSIFFYHHRDPAMIQRDVRRLSKVPTVLSVILRVDEDEKGGAELERLVNEVAEVSAWCASAGIPALNVYEKTGTRLRMPWAGLQLTGAFRPPQTVPPRNPPSNLAEPAILLWQATSHPDGVRAPCPVDRVPVQPTERGLWGSSWSPHHAVDMR